MDEYLGGNITEKKKESFISGIMKYQNEDRRNAKEKNKTCKRIKYKIKNEMFENKVF